MKEQTSEPGNHRQFGPQVGLKVVTPLTSAKDPASASMSRAQRRRGDADTGIEVREEELCAVTSQRMFKMRCECGRSWFELESKKFVNCPACHKLGLVTG